MDVPIKRIIDNLNEPSLELLRLIKDNPGISFKDIRQQSNYSQEKTYKLLALLEGGILIQSQRQNDARSNGYETTKYGDFVLTFLED